MAFLKRSFTFLLRVKCFQNHSCTFWGLDDDEEIAVREAYATLRKDEDMVNELFDFSLA